MLTVDSPFIAEPRINRATFERVLKDAGSPWADQAIGLHTLIVSAKQDPAVWLAICAEEHTYGTNRDSVLWRNDTRSWTNARTVRHPGITGWEIITDAVRGTKYVKYASVQDSLRDGLYRVTDPTYRYVKEKRTTIGQVIGIWTEGDGPRYAAAVVQRINRWMAEENEGGTPVATPYDHIIPGMIDARSQLATATQNQGGVPRGPYERIPLSAKRGVVVHYRGVVTDVNAGLASFKSDATYHVGKNWARAGEAPVLGSGIMYHIGIDGEGNVYLLRDLDRVLWHCGAWPQNENTLAIQLPLGGNQRATNKQLMALNEVVDHWLAFTKAPDTEVWGHQELSPTDCPGTLMTDFVKPYRNAPATLPSQFFNETGHTVGGGFLQFWLAKGGLQIFGYPITEEFIEKGRTVQYFERARFEHHPNSNPSLWDVMLGRVGAELIGYDE